MLTILFWKPFMSQLRQMNDQDVQKIISTLQFTELPKSVIRVIDCVKRFS